MINPSRVDIHLRNVLFRLPDLDKADLTPDTIEDVFGEPKLAAVTRHDGGECGPEVPKYLVMPAEFDSDYLLFLHEVQLIDFGESFFVDRCPSSYHTALTYTPPELLFGLPITKAVDMWSLGLLVKPKQIVFSFLTNFCWIFEITIGGSFFWVLCRDNLKEEFKDRFGEFHINTSSNGEKSIVPAGG